MKIAGGREKNLRDLQSWIFYVGGTSGLIGNYLATAGRANEEDLQMIEDLELTWHEDRVGDLDPNRRGCPPRRSRVAVGTARPLVTLGMLSWMDDDLDERRRRGLYRTRRRLQSAQGPSRRAQGPRIRQLLLQRLSRSGRRSAAGRGRRPRARRYGCGAGASPLVSGLTPPLRRLERTLAEWEGTEAALVFSSGFAANLAVVSTWPGREDAVFSDAWNHASLIDGCRLSRARVHVYRHADLNHLAELLRTETNARRRVIVSDSVFSMDGDLAPLPGLLELAERFDALLVLDEAHATGVLGEHGRGVTELLDAAPTERLIKVGTLSKALGAQGGFVCGSRRLIAVAGQSRAAVHLLDGAGRPPAAAARPLSPWKSCERTRAPAPMLALAEQLRADCGNSV